MPCMPAMINNHQVCLEFAKAVPAQIQGLSNKKSIPDDYALVFDTASLGKGKAVFFTMSGMKFPIDIIFVKNNKILLIEYNVKPCKTTPDKCQVFGGFPVDMVLETKVGNVSKWGIQMFQQFNVINNTKVSKK